MTELEKVHARVRAEYVKASDAVRAARIALAEAEHRLAVATAALAQFQPIQTVGNGSGDR